MGDLITPKEFEKCVFFVVVGMARSDIFTIILKKKHLKLKVNYMQEFILAWKKCP